MSRSRSIIDLLSLSCFGKIGPRGFAKMEAALGDKWAQAKSADLISLGLKPEVAHEYKDFRNKFDTELELKKLADLGITLLAADDPQYPTLLKEISDPPFLLYVWGEVEALSGMTVALVGSRRHSHYGAAVIEKLVPELVQHGFTIVSGLAYGIDSLAHKSTLSSQGQTVAVIGGGLDNIYPAENRPLAKRMVENGGAVVSEYALGTPPLKQHFPARNRILSGLSKGVIVIECGLKSGAMITAHHALDQNREVFAVPGSIVSEYSDGPNSLLRMGARPVSGAIDIVEAFDLKWQGGADQVIVQPLGEMEKAIFELIGADPVHIDTVVSLSKLKSDEVGSALVFLEMKGLIRNVGAANYVRR